MKRERERERERENERQTDRQRLIDRETDRDRRLPVRLKYQPAGASSIHLTVVSSHFLNAGFEAWKSK